MSMHGSRFRNMLQKLYLDCERFSIINVLVIID